MKSKIPTNPQSDTLRILILEDVPTDAKLVERELKRAKIVFTPRHVDKRDAFLKELEDFLPDIVLSDYSMPQFNGLEALELVLELTPSIPFIMVTGSINEETAVECMKKGAADYVIKENLIRLGPAVKSAMEKKRIREEKERAQEDLRKRTYDLRERVKELNCLYGISKLIEEGDISMEEMARRIVNLLPPAWQYPEITCARIILEGQEFRTGNFKETAWKQTCDITIHDELAGAVEVDYLEEKPENDEGPFLKEERDLIEAITQRIGKITEHKRAEEALRNSEEKYSTLFNEARDGIVLTDLEGRIVDCNLQFEHLTGRYFHELEQMKIWEIRPPEKVKLAKEKFQEIKDKGFSGSDELEFQKPDGTIVPIEFFAKRVEFLNRQYIQGIVHDITERRNAEREKRTLETQLFQSQKMEAIGTLAGGIAHDFNNLLTTIIGNAKLALNDISKDDSLREEIEEILKAGERSASLTRQLLAFSRKQVIKPEVLDLNEVINETEKMLKRMIGEDIEFQTVLKPELWKVHMDSGQVDQMFINMVVNSRDAMPQGGKLTIEMANVDLDKNYLSEHGIEGAAGHYVMLAVSDTGSGMDKETREHIFEPFFTTKEIGKGTGLGLSTVYGIVKQNKGFIWVYSEPGQGTTFKIYLPKVKEGTEPEEKERTPVGDLNGSETVLIVEDDDRVRNLARKILERYGYSVLEAENGEDALRASEEHDGSIDLMITDVVMPKMSGKETVEHLQPLYPQMKVIYMSGYTDNAIVHHGVLAPGLNFLEKPFAPEGLARKVREVLDR